VYSYGGISTTYKNAKKELHEQIKNIIGNSEYNILVKRNRNNINILKILRKLIKYLLPYGIYKLYLYLKCFLGKE